MLRSVKQDRQPACQLAELSASLSCDSLTLSCK